MLRFSRSVCQSGPRGAIVPEPHARSSGAGSGLSRRQALELGRAARSPRRAGSAAAAAAAAARRAAVGLPRPARLAGLPLPRFAFLPPSPAWPASCRRRHPAARACPASPACRRPCDIWRHHLLRLEEAVDELVDLGDRRARSRVAMRARREPLRIFGVLALRRRHRLDDRRDPVDVPARRGCRSAPCISPMPGSIPSSLDIEPILRDGLHLREEVLEGEAPPGLRPWPPCSAAWSASNAFSACSIRVSMSPMPRMRGGHPLGVEDVEVRRASRRWTRT